MKPRSVLLFLLLPGTIAFTYRSSTPEPEPCNVQLLAEREPAWQLVRAEGFTFCVPGDWSASGKAPKTGVAPHAWRTRGASISWSTGSYSPRREAATVTLPVIAGSPPSGARPEPPPNLPQANVQRFTEEIDGRDADLWVSDLRNTFRTGAVWSAPLPIYLLGQANSRTLAAVHLEIYRSVRFNTE